MKTEIRGQRAENGNKENLFYRHFDLNERGRLNEESREIEISFSSEEPVERWFGKEILLHGEKNVDFKRLRNVGSLIYGHNAYDMKNIIGPIKKVFLDVGEKNARALVGFDEDETGNIAMQKVKNKSLRGVSFGYDITKGRRLLEDEEWTDPDSNRTFKGPAIIGTRWMPYEMSLTPIPADATVGVGREMTRSLDGVDITTNKKQEDSEMKEEEIRALIESVLEERATPQAPSIDEIVKQVRAAMDEDSKPKMNITVDQLQDRTARAAAVSDECFKQVTTDALAGKTEAELLRTINDAMTKSPDAEDTPGHQRDNADDKDKKYKTAGDIPEDVLKRSLK